MKAVLIILDGLGDRTYAQLDNKTPLQFAATPNLDKLAELGMSGLMYPITPGIAPATELVHFVLFGYPLADFPGRAVFEAVGDGFDLNAEDVIVRASFASVEEKGEDLVVVDRVLEAEEPALSVLADDIGSEKFGEIGFEFIYGAKRQGNLFLRGDVSREITDSDPFVHEKPVVEVQAWEESDEYEKAANTAEMLNRFLLSTYQVLDKHPLNQQRRKDNMRPINFLLTKWAGKRKNFPSFYEMSGFRGASVSSSSMLKGLVSEIGVDFINAPKLRNVAEDLDNRFKIAKEALSAEYDFVHVHTKAPDEAAHKKDPLLKTRVIEELDSVFVKLISGGFFGEDTLVIVTADHSTPSSGTLIHSGEPVPIMLVGTTIRCDGMARFNELACASGGIGQITGSDLMHVILNYTDRIKYLGSRLTAKDVPHYPVIINSLKK